MCLFEGISFVRCPGQHTQTKSKEYRFEIKDPLLCVWLSLGSVSAHFGSVSAPSHTSHRGSSTKHPAIACEQSRAHASQIEIGFAWLIIACLICQNGTLFEKMYFVKGYSFGTPKKLQSFKIICTFFVEQYNLCAYMCSHGA